MNNIIVTSGSKYIDIDAYAGCIAYAFLLRSINISAHAVTSAPLNESIPSLIKNIDLSFENYPLTDNDKFIILDVSNPNMFDNIVKKDKIIKIIDHHTGYEEFWNEKFVNKEIKEIEIEFIGSICTIIYEKFVNLEKTSLLSPNLCKLLIAAILDNTLNLKASITTSRDIKAYHELMKLGKIDKNFGKDYFKACEEEILKDLPTSIINDTKLPQENINLPACGQLTVFSGKKILKQISLIKNIFNNYDEWMMNIISLEDGKSYIIATSPKTKKQLEKLFNKKFSSDIITLDKFMLRKEIIKLATTL